MNSKYSLEIYIQISNEDSLTLSETFNIEKELPSIQLQNEISTTKCLLTPEQREKSLLEKTK